MGPETLTPFITGAIVFTMTRVRPLWSRLPDWAQPYPAIALGAALGYYLGDENVTLAFEGALFGLSAIGGHHTMKRVPFLKKLLRLGQQELAPKAPSFSPEEEVTKP